MDWIKFSLLLVLLAESSVGATECPCLPGGEWSYLGASQLYCENPNRASQNWCPTEDAVYDGGKFAYCSGEVLAACETLRINKKAELAAATQCPCQQSWSYKSKVYNYCKTDTDCDAWCPVKPELVSSLGAKTTYCTSDILAACETERESQPKPVCPCVSGGQWTYQGKPQSYCSNPTKSNRANWCYNDVGQVKFCHGDIETSCKELEGTLPVETEDCPCLDGGEWTLQGTQLSYCQIGSCPRTHSAVSSTGNNNMAKCTSKAKAACSSLKSLETESGRTAMFGSYTKASTGCACWFDMTRTDCACCNTDAVQCGAPMQNYCYKKFDGRQRGCPGVPASQWTLATTGHVCAGNRSRTDCAWCAPGGGQCRDELYGPGSSYGNRCWNSQDEEYCGVTTPNSCDVTHDCDSQATCSFDRKFGAYLEVTKCTCKEGWVGNGLQCFDAVTGEASVEVSGSGDVSLTLVMKTERFTLEADKTENPEASEPGLTLLTNIETVFTEGETCSKETECDGTFATVSKAPETPSN